MPLSPSTDPVFVDVKPGREYIITANSGGNVDVSTILKTNGTTVEQTEGTVLDTERKLYKGSAHQLKITPSDIGVYWTVTESRKGD